MNDYLDSSALVKLLIREADSDVLVGALSDTRLLTCRITYAEARAAIARREREAPDRALEWAAARAQLEADWPGYVAIDITQALVQRAGEFSEAFALRAYDAVQLAAADLAHATMAEPTRFRSYDRRLNRAARLLGLQLPEEALF